MMRVAYIAGEDKAVLPKPKRRTKNDAFLEEVNAVISARSILDEQRASEMFADEIAELEKLKTTLNKLKHQRDEVL